MRSEALECVQLAAAFLPASLLAGISNSRMMPRPTLMVPQARRLSRKQAGEKITFQTSRQTGWGKSGSKLHALQSFAPNASDEKSTPAPPRAGEKVGLGIPTRR
jgi:hypothetical protein